MKTGTSTEWVGGWFFFNFFFISFLSFLAEEREPTYFSHGADGNAEGNGNHIS